MKLRLLGLAMAGVLASGTFASSVGVVDVQTIFDQTPQGHATLLKLQSSIQPQVDALKQQQESLQTDEQTFERNESTLSAADRKTQGDALDKRQQDFQAQVTALRDSETKQEKAAAEVFSEDLKTAVATVAVKDKLDVVLSADAAPYANASSDVTPEVVMAMTQLAKANNNAS